MAVKGLIPSGALGLVALLLVAKGWSLKRQDHALMARLVRTKARVTDAGDVPQTSIFTQSDGTQRQDVSYEGRYEFTVGSTTYTGTESSHAPVFAMRQLPPNTIHVYYDPANPSASRLQMVPDTTGSNYVRFGMVVLAVALLIAVISNLGHLID